MYTRIVKLAKIFNKNWWITIIPIWQIPSNNNELNNHLTAEDGTPRHLESTHTKAGNNSKNFQWTSERRHIPLVWIWNGFPSCKLLGETPMWTHIRSSAQLLHCYLATPKTGAAHVSSTPPRLLIKPIFESTGVQFARFEHSRCQDSCIYLEIVFPWCDSTLSGSQILKQPFISPKINK